MHKKIIIKLILAVILFTIGSMILTQGNVANAKPVSTYLDELASKPGINIKTDVTVSIMVGRIINGVLGFLGILFLVIILYAGFIWMTAGGGEEEVTKARGLIKWAIIGIIVITGAYAISYYVVDQIGTVANAPKPPTPDIPVEDEPNVVLPDVNIVNCNVAQDYCAGCGTDEYCCIDLGSCCIFQHGSCAVPN